MASLVATPNPARVGQSIALLGEGFVASTPTAVRIDSEGFASEITSDAGGLLSNDDISDHAAATLTLAVVVADAETVTIGGRTYTFKTTLTPTVNQVLIGANASASLDNLKAAVNGAAGAGTTYASGTAVHADVIAAAKTATTLKLVARVAGTDGNSLASTETLAGAGNQFGGTVFAGGAGDPTGVRSMEWIPTKPGTFNVVANDGTNSATAKVQVFQSA